MATTPVKKPNADQQKFFDQYSANRTAGKGQSAERDAYYNTLAKTYGLQTTAYKDPKVNNSYNALNGGITSMADFNKLDKTSDGFVKMPDGSYATPDGLMKLSQDEYDAFGLSKGKTTKLDDAYGIADKNKMDEFMKQMNDMYAPMIGQYNSYLGTLQGQHQNNLNMIDAQGNRTLQGVSDNNFLAAQQNEQSLADRGMGTSGVGDEFRTRTQMSANRNLQDSYMQTAQQKADENSQFSQNENQIKMALAELNPEAKGQAMYQNWLDTTGGSKGIKESQAAAQQQAQAKNDEYLSSQTGVLYQNGQVVKDAKGNAIKTLDGQKLDLDKTKAQLDANIALAKVQNDRDKLMSTSGNLYINGKAVKDSKGNAVKTLDYLKLSQKAQNDIVKNSISQQNANTNLYNAETKRSKALADVAARSKEIQIKQSNADLNSAKYNLSVDKYNDSVTKAAAALDNKALSKQVSDLQRKAKDALSLAKKAKPDSKQYKEATKAYNAYNKQIETAINKYATSNSGK